MAAERSQWYAMMTPLYAAMGQTPPPMLTPSRPLAPQAPNTGGRTIPVVCDDDAPLCCNGPNSATDATAFSSTCSTGSIHSCELVYNLVITIIAIPTAIECCANYLLLCAVSIRGIEYTWSWRFALWYSTSLWFVLLTLKTYFCNPISILTISVYFQMHTS